MNRLRRWSVICFTMVGVAGVAPADDQKPPAGEKWLVDRELTVTARAEPQPALKYRLLPLVSELKEGNAVPIYLRPVHGQSDAGRKNLTEKPRAWNDMPLDRVPLSEARKFLAEVRVRFLDQLDYGARRRTAEWNYTLDQPDAISMLLPDLSTMRDYAPMLVLRARVAIADGDYAAAARSFQTGLAFSRHVGEDGPFLIGGLVGVAIANLHVDRIPEWVERPDSPNLYWSLTALPRPLIGFRRQFEFEQRVLQMQFPDLVDLDRPRTAAEWDAALRRFRTEVRRIDPLVASFNADVFQIDRPAPAPDPDEPATKSPDLAAARQYVTGLSGKPAADVAAMPPAQVLLLDIAGRYADLRDDMFKLTYLPYAQAHPRLPAAAERLRTATGGEGVRLAKLFLPAIAKAMTAHVRLERKIALLRTIEALRLHAAANGGQLPRSLDAVTVVPVPLDPGTGKGFEYALDGATATLTTRLPGEPLETTGLRYRVTVRGK